VPAAQICPFAFQYMARSTMIGAVALISAANSPVIGGVCVLPTAMLKRRCGSTV